MIERDKLFDLEHSYPTYIAIGALLAAAGMIVASLGGWFAPGVMAAIGNILAAPGRLLFAGGLVAAGVAAARLSPGVRITSLAVAGALILRIVAEARAEAAFLRAFQL